MYLTLSPTFKTSALSLRACRSSNTSFFACKVEWELIFIWTEFDDRDFALMSRWLGPYFYHHVNPSRWRSLKKTIYHTAYEHPMSTRKEGHILTSTANKKGDL